MRCGAVQWSGVEWEVEVEAEVEVGAEVEVEVVPCVKRSLP